MRASTRQLLHQSSRRQFISYGFRTCEEGGKILLPPFRRKTRCYRHAFSRWHEPTRAIPSGFSQLQERGIDFRDVGGHRKQYSTT